MGGTLTLVVMAAGMGSRYGGLKQTDGFGPNGETLLEYSLKDAFDAGFNKAVFVIRKSIESAFRENVLRRFESVVDTECVFQELNDLPGGFIPPSGREKPWGTGQAVLAARHAVKGPFAVINADDFYGRDSFARIASFLRTNTEPHHYALCGYRLLNTLSEHGTVSRGLCKTDPSGRLLNVTEHTQIGIDTQGRIRSETFDLQLGGDEFVSMNFWGFTPAFFASLEAQFTRFLALRGQEAKSEFYLPFAVDHDLQNGSAKAFLLPTESPWFGVTYPDDKPRVQKAIRERVARGEYPSNLWPSKA